MLLFCVFWFVLLRLVIFALNWTKSPKRCDMLVTQTQIQKRTLWRMAGRPMAWWVNRDPVHRSQAITALLPRRSGRHPREPLHHHHPRRPVSSRNRGWKKENRSTLLYYSKKQESALLRTHLTKVTEKKNLRYAHNCLHASWAACSCHAYQCKFFPKKP